MTKYRYLNAPAGSGKSYWASNLMLENPARYLLVRDRRDAIAEYISGLHVMKGNRHVHIEAITTDNTKHVRSTIRDYPKWHDDEHIILIITHAGMMGSDLSAYDDWEIIIDETPSIFDQQKLTTKLSADVLAARYDIEPIGYGWHRVTANNMAKRITPAEMGADDILQPLRLFHERVLEATAGERCVICDVADWSDLSTRETSGWSWWSLWSLHSLKAFASVTIMANAFDKSLTLAALRKLHPDIVWQRIDIETRLYKTRPVHIEYFASSHCSSSHLFGSNNGQENLRAIAQHLSSDEDRIWTTNDSWFPWLKDISGTKLSPLQAGSNSYAHIDHAVMIYAAKPSPEIVAILEAINIDPAIWTETVEHEAILQFMCRTSVRDPESTRPVFLSVYSKAQADYLAHYFAELPHCTVHLQLTDLGFANDERKAGRPVSGKSDEEKRAQNRERQRKFRARQKAAA